MTPGTRQDGSAPACAARSPLSRVAARTGIAGIATAAAATVAAGTMALLLAGCGDGGDRAAIQGGRAKVTAEVVREAAAARYVPPADGRLTDAQLRMYLKVREREDRIREAAAIEELRRRESAPARGGARQAARDDGGLAAADLRAAQELRVNPKEYAWVRAKVQEAESAAAAQALNQRMAAGREQLLARMRRDRDALSDPQRRAAAEREIEDYKRGLQATEPQMPPAVRANVALLARYRDPLARLRALEIRALAAGSGLDAPAGDGATGEGR